MQIHIYFTMTDVQQQWGLLRAYTCIQVPAFFTFPRTYKPWIGK